MSGFVGALLMVGVTFGAPAAPEKSEVTSPIGKKIPDFKLRDFRGTWHSLEDLKDSKLVVVAFLGTECPLVTLYAGRLEELSNEFAAKGVTFIGINSNQQDSITEIDHFVRRFDLHFPMLKDPGNTVADLFGAIRTPEIFVLDQDRVIRYWGRVDDQFGIGFAREKPTRRDLVVAIDELLEGKPVSMPVVTAPGCFIGRVRQPKESSEVTYSKQISRIFQNRCQECHRAGEIAPFALTSYEEAVGWSETIREVVQEQRMPPWHASPEHGHFLNDARLTEEEKKQIETWVANGSPEGDPKDLPEPPKFAEGWRIPEPDLVLEMPYEFEVPAEGVVDYKHIMVDPGLTEDKFIQFAEAKAGNRSVVHHIIVFIRPPESRRDDLKVEGDFGGGRFLVATAPGARPMMLEEGYGKLIPAGSKLIFQMHYTPNGTKQKDRSSIALKFADSTKVKRKVSVANPGQFAFRIPPHEENYKMAATHFFRRDTQIIAFLPHMHKRGKSFKYEVFYPDGRHQVLLDIPRYDFNWQNSYVLDKPLEVPRGTKMVCTAHFDNSANNLAHPNPNDSVTWGEQTWQEMMFGFFEWAPVKEDAYKSDKTRTEEFLELAHDGPAMIDTKLIDLARRASQSFEDFQRFADALRDELPQLDRVCVTLLDGDLFRVAAASEGSEVNNGYAETGFERLANGFTLAKYAKDKQTVIHPDLAKAIGFDLRLLARSFRSSMHIPFILDGKPATMNLWSGEGNAFPEPAKRLIEALFDTAAPTRIVSSTSTNSANEG
ncbi:MAG: redoxin domain-containing protein [Planctomycetota bacterium]